MHGTTLRSDIFLFLRSLMFNPRRVAAIAPSSARLARVITQDITPDTGRVLELGPGTGVFTRALLSRGITEANLTLIEYGEDFAEILKQRFPAAEVIAMNAANLGDCGHFDHSHFGAVISGLPLLSMPPKAVTAIVSGAFRVLRPGGSLYQFTYGPRCPVKPGVLHRLGLKAARIGGTLLNVPPASVYQISRLR